MPKTKSKENTYPTTEVLKKMTPRQYAAHWKRICAEIEADDPDGTKLYERVIQCPQSFNNREL